MAQIDKVRLPNGQIVRPTEWSSTPLYSSVFIAAGPITTLQAFSYGLGGAVPGTPQLPAKEAHTNMSGPGSVLPENEELLCYSVMVELFQTVEDSGDFFSPPQEEGCPDDPEVSAMNVGRIQRDTLLEMWIANTKKYISHPIGFFPAGMGLCTTTGAAVSVLNPNGGPILGGQNGLPNVYDRRQLATPHQVRGGEAFLINFVFPNGEVRGLNFGQDEDARIWARVYADGYRKRPVA